MAETSCMTATNLSTNVPRGSYWITTFGCQMNKADSERMAGILEAMGYRAGDDEHTADLVLYNTCTIRDNAEQKVYSYLGRQAQRKRGVHCSQLRAKRAQRDGQREQMPE